MHSTHNAADLFLENNANEQNKPFVISLLVAVAENGVIGANNALPWHLPNDLKYFKNRTWAMPVLMGRKTFESIGKALPGRKNIVITRNREWQKESAYPVYSVEEAISLAQKDGVKEIFVIGGAEIFSSTLPQANRVYLTRVHAQFKGDVFFPELDQKEWRQTGEVKCKQDEKNAYDHTFEIWERRGSTS